MSVFAGRAVFPATFADSLGNGRGGLSITVYKRITYTDGVTVLGSKRLTSATAAFTSADEGKSISAENFPSGATIETYVSATAVDLSVAATAAGTGKSFIIAGRQRSADLATVYADRLKSATTSNPYVADVDGNTFPYVDPGDYDAVTVHGVTPFTVLPDHAEPLATAVVQEAMLAFNVATQVELDAVAAYVEVSLAGIDDTGMADVGAAINAVYAARNAQDIVRWNPRGTYRSTVPIVITCGTEADGALVRADHNGDGVVVGTDAVEPFNVTIKLPDIEKVTQTWTSSPLSITADVGLRVHSANACRIHWPYIRRFATSVVMDPGPASGAKVAYCTFYPGRTDLTARNWLVSPSGNGFANQNTVIGGEPKHNVGSALAGTYQLKMTTTGAFQPDNWTFIGTAFEGDGPEWHVDACASFLVFLNCRWEHNVRSRVRANAISASIYAHDWKILGGFDAAKLIPTLVSPAKCIEVNSEGSHRRSFNDALGGMTLNSVVSSATALITLVSVAADIWGIDPLTAYNVVLAATGIKLKQTADTQPRLDIAQDGILSWSSGAAAADVNLFRQGIDLLRTNDEFQAARELVARVGSANGQVRAGAVGPSSVAAILFGSAEDVNLYRPSANLLKTDDRFVAVGGVDTRVVATASLPAAGASMDGHMLIEDAGAGDRNLIIYAGGQRFRIDGGANV